jgi:hypothetical protein
MPPPVAPPPHRVLTTYASPAACNSDSNRVFLTHSELHFGLDLTGLPAAIFGAFDLYST